MIWLLSILFAVGSAGAVEDVLKQREPPRRFDECQNCHAAKTLKFQPGLKKNLHQHQDIEFIHGTKPISCNSCHDKNNHNFLYSARSPNDFSHSSETCQTCHQDIYSSWSKGLHGKRTGGWNKTETRLNCIDCHDPHRVKFPATESLPPPPRPKLSIPKHSDAGKE